MLVVRAVLCPGNKCMPSRVPTVGSTPANDGTPKAILFTELHLQKQVAHLLSPAPYLLKSISARNKCLCLLL